MSKFQDFPEDNEQLLEVIGRSIPSGERGAFGIPPGSDEARRRAMEWFNEKHAVLRGKLCPNREIRAAESKVNPHQHSLERDLLLDMICGALADPLVGVHGLSAGAIAAYIIRRTIRWLCESQGPLFP